MYKNQRKVTDITDVELAPGEPTICTGNGDQSFECCCDECDYYLLCFSELDPINKAMLKIRFVFADHIKRTKNLNNSSSFSIGR